MFTGIVQEVGSLREVRAHAGHARLTVGCTFSQLELGESIAVDGCCLTVDRILADGFEADASEETLRRTTIGQATRGDRVNLERALRPHDRLGGHLVSGHVDGLGIVRELRTIGGAQKLVIGLEPTLAPFLAEKGSITMAGVSLTVNGVSEPRAREPWFDVALIPHTQSKTTLHALAVGSRINLEIDVVARYVARLLAFGQPHAAPSLHELLQTHGFTS